MGTLAAQPQEAVIPSWRTILRAMAQTGGASLLSGFLTLFAMKIVAVVLGSAQLALLSSLQQLRQAAVTGGTLSGQTALAQGASAFSGEARREYLRTSLVLMATATTIVCSALVWAPEWIAAQTGLPGRQSGLAKLLVLAVVPMVAFVFLAAIMNASGAIGSLAMVQLAAPAAMLLLAYPITQGARYGQSELLVGMLALSSLAAVVGAGMALHWGRGRISGWIKGSGQWWSTSAARHFVSISASIFASGIFSSCVVLAVRGQVLRSQGLAVGGEFDAAWSISMNQAGLVLASLQTYYLPVLAKARNPEERAVHIGRVLTVGAGAGATLIALIAVLKPTVIKTLYSSEFLGATRYLRWTLIGDYLKVTSWILSIPLVASANMRAFLAADLSAYAAFAVGAFGFARWFSAAESAGIAFAVMYAVHLLFCGGWLYARGEFRPGKQVLGLWMAGLAIVLGSSALFWEQV